MKNINKTSLCKSTLLRSSSDYLPIFSHLNRYFRITNITNLYEATQFDTRSLTHLKPVALLSRA